MSSSTRTKTAEAPDLSGTKGRQFGPREFVCHMRNQKNAVGASMRVGTLLADEDGEAFVYVVTRNGGRDPDSRQPEYLLGKAQRTEVGGWSEPRKVAGLWVGTTNAGLAEPFSCLVGKTDDKATRFTFLPDGHNLAGGPGAALFQASLVEIEDTGEPDAFLD